MPATDLDTKGLTSEEVLQSRIKYGYNRLSYKKESGFADAVLRLVKEPMVILLMVASAIYFVSGSIGDGIFLASSIVLVSLISLYQDSKSRNALEKLKDFTRPGCKVIRDGVVQEIKTDDLVMGDSLMTAATACTCIYFVYWCSDRSNPCKWAILFFTQAKMIVIC